MSEVSSVEMTLKEAREIISGERLVFGDPRHVEAVNVVEQADAAKRLALKLAADDKSGRCAGCAGTGTCQDCGGSGKR